MLANLNNCLFPIPLLWKKKIGFSQALTEMSESCNTFLWFKIKGMFKSWNSVNMYMTYFLILSSRKTQKQGHLNSIEHTYHSDIGF